jgi:hypothetical protein
LASLLTAPAFRDLGAFVFEFFFCFVIGFSVMVTGFEPAAHARLQRRWSQVHWWIIPLRSWY